MISVNIPAYNAASFIRRAIDSALAQTYSDCEVIVVDDGSTDNTAELVQGYGSRVKYIYQDNAGESVARNTAIAASSGQWIAPLDADDEWLPEKLERQMHVLDRNPQLRWCATNRYQSHGRRSSVLGNVTAITKALRGKDYFDNFFIANGTGVCPVITTVMLVHRDLFDELGLFEPGRISGPDLDMWWRIAYQYPEIGYVAEPMATVYMEMGDTMLTERRLTAKRGTYARDLISKHLKLAEQQGCLKAFRPYASRFLRKRLLTAIYHGLGPDARQIVAQFPDLVPWRWRVGTRLLTVFPQATSALLKKLAYARYRLGLEKQVTRRWVYSESADNSVD